MNKLYFFLLAVAISSHIQSQNYYEKAFSFKENITIGENQPLIHAFDENKFLYLIYEEEVLKLIGSTDKLNNLYEIEIPDSIEYFPTFNVINDRLVILLMNKEDDIFSLVANTHSTTKGDLISSKIIYKGKFKPTILFDLFDKNFALIYKNDESTNCKVFDYSTLEVMNSLTLELENKVSDITMLENGDLVWCSLNKKSGTLKFNIKKQFSDISSFDTNVDGFNQNYDYQIQLIPLNINEINVVIIADHLAAISTKKRSQLKTLEVYKIRLESLSVLNKSKISADELFMEKLSQEVNNNMLVRGKFKRKKFFYELNLTQTFIDEEGSVYLILEELVGFSYVNSYSRRASPNNGYPVLYANDILISKFNSSLKNEWNKLIIREEFAQTGFAWVGFGFHNIVSKAFIENGSLLILTPEREKKSLGTYIRELNLKTSKISYPKKIEGSSNYTYQNYTELLNNGKIIIMNTDRRTLVKNFVLKSTSFD